MMTTCTKVFSLLEWPIRRYTELTDL